MSWLSLTVPWTPEDRARIDRANDTLEEIRDLLRNQLRPPKPGPTSLSVTGEKNMALQFDLELPAVPSPSDIVDQKLTVVVDGVTVKDAESVAIGTVTVTGFEGADGAEVSVEHWYVDDAGNDSAKSVLNQTLVDTIAPPSPSAITLTVTGETN